MDICFIGLTFVSGNFENGFNVRLDINKIREGLVYSEQTSLDGFLPSLSNLDEQSICEEWQTWRSLYKLAGYQFSSSRASIDFDVAQSKYSTQETPKSAYLKLQSTMRDWYKINHSHWNIIREKISNYYTQSKLEGFATHVAILLSPEMVESNPILTKLPWEEWFTNTEMHTSICTLKNSDDSVSKNISSYYSFWDRLFPKIRILHLVGDDTNENKEKEIHPERDVAILKEIERKIPLEITTQSLTSFKSMGEALHHPRCFDILIYSGHSRKEDTGYIALKSKDKLAIRDFEKSFKYLIDKGLKIAFFNSCISDALAESLLEKGLGTIIATREIIYEEIANKFLDTFFQEYLLNNQSVYQSLRRTIAQLEEFQSDEQFPGAVWIPVIYQNFRIAPPLRSEILQGRRQTRKISSLSFAVTVVVILMRIAGSLEIAELKLFDALLRLRPLPSTFDERVIALTISPQDLELLPDKYPDLESTISDRALTDVLMEVHKAEPNLIGLDIFRDRPIGDQADHEKLIDVLNKSDHLVSICHVYNSPSQASIAPPPGLKEESIVFSDVPDDIDNTIRRQLLYTSTPKGSLCSATNSLAFSLALLHLSEKGISPNPDSNILKFGQKSFPLLKGNAGAYKSNKGRSPFQTETYQILFDPQPRRHSIKEIPLTEFFQHPNPPDLRNKIVLIGYDIPARDEKQNDRHYTAYGEVPGVVVQAQMVSQFLNVVLDDQPMLWVLPIWGDYVWIIGWGAMAGSMAIGVTLLKKSRHTELLICLASLGGLFLFDFLVLWIWGLWLPFLPPFLILIGVPLGKEAIVADKD